MGKIKEWFTGRKDLYFDKDKYEALVENVKSIKTSPVVSARDTVSNAVRDLNNVNGMQQYVGSVSEGAFNDIFDGGVVSCIDNVLGIMEQKRTDAENYSNASFGEKVFGSATMAVGKISEGFLSVFEGIGDGVLSLVGFTGGLLGAEGFRDSIGQIVKYDVSEKATSFITDSEIAKKSAFTKDSGAAGLFEAVGQTGGYLALGGFANGAVKGFGGVKGKTGKIVNGLFGTSTRANTTNAVLGGLGRGTETGLKQGMDFNHAFGEGAKQAAIQGAIAYGAGKYGEHKQKQQAIKKAHEDAAKMTQKAQEKADRMTQAAQDKANRMTNAAESKLNASKATKAKMETDLANAKNDLIKFDKGIQQQNKDLLSRYRSGSDPIIKTQADYRKALSDLTKDAAAGRAKIQGDIASLQKGLTSGTGGIVDDIAIQTRTLDRVRQTGAANVDAVKNKGIDFVNRYKDSGLAKVGKVEAQKLNEFVGYNDRLSNWARGKGETFGASVANNGLVGSAKVGLTAAGTALTGAGSNVKNAFKHPINTAKSGVRATGHGLTSAGKGLKNAGSSLVTGVKNVAAHPVASLGRAGSTLLKAAPVAAIEGVEAEWNRENHLTGLGGVDDIKVDKVTVCIHDWVEASRTEPTTTNPGFVTSRCTKCGATKTDTIPPIEIETDPSPCKHNWVFVDSVKNGNMIIKNYKCSLCGALNSVTEEIPYDPDQRPVHVPGGHKHVFIFVQTVPPTSLEEGYDLYRCECGLVEKRNIVPKLEEIPDPFEHVCRYVFKYHVAPTYTTEGYDVYMCDECGKTEKRNIIPKLEEPSTGETGPTGPTGPSGPFGPSGPSGPGIHDVTDDLTEEDLNINEDNLNVETSLAELIGSSGVNIPTSEEPIFEPKKKRKSMIPLVAGLGSAAAAGLVTKAVLDRKDEKEENEDFGTEEWADDSLDSDTGMMEENLDTVSVDDVEGDYLTPADEYGYGEASDSEDEIYESTSEVVTE